MFKPLEKQRTGGHCETEYPLLTLEEFRQAVLSAIFSVVVLVAEGYKGQQLTPGYHYGCRFMFTDETF